MLVGYFGICWRMTNKGVITMNTRERLESGYERFSEWWTKAGEKGTKKFLEKHLTKVELDVFARMFVYINRTKGLEKAQNFYSSLIRHYWLVEEGLLNKDLDNFAEAVFLSVVHLYEEDLKISSFYVS
jgi:hypothetical protein